MSLFYRVSADVIVVVHFVFVLFVIFGQLAILVGILRKWPWVRGMTFRVVHLTAILFVVAEALCGVTCPLTTWEQDLRTLSGGATYQGDFIPNLVHNWLFYDADSSVFTVCYVAFGGLVLLTFIFAPPRRRK